MVWTLAISTNAQTRQLDRSGKMNIRPLSSDEYLITTFAIYTVAIIVNMFVYEFAHPAEIQAVWILITASPLFIPMTWVVSMDPVWRWK